MTNSHKKFMKPLQVSIMQALQTCKKTYNFKLKMQWKKSEKDDFKYIISNLQNQDHKITTNDATSSDSPCFPT